MKSLKDKTFNPHVLKYFRILKHWTQAELAKALNTSTRTVRNWEGGHTAPPKGKNTKTVNVHAIAAAFEVDADIFFIPMPNSQKRWKRKHGSPIFSGKSKSTSSATFLSLLFQPTIANAHTHFAF